MRKMPRTASWVVFAVVSLTLLSWSGGPQALADGPREGFFPSVTLETQDKKKVAFYEDLIKGKTVVINVMYTTCEGKLCRQGMENLKKVQKLLQSDDRLRREVFMYSISLDPEDTPAALKKYAEKLEIAAKPDWTFLTGKEADIQKLRRSLGLFNRDPKKDADRTQHTGMIRIGNEAIDKWNSASILDKPQRIVNLIRRVMPAKPSKQ